jgi:hypothetical protein
VGGSHRRSELFGSILRLIFMKSWNKLKQTLPQSSVHDWRASWAPSARTHRYQGTGCKMCMLVEMAPNKPWKGCFCFITYSRCIIFLENIFVMACSSGTPYPHSSTLSLSSKGKGVGQACAIN